MRERGLQVDVLVGVELDPRALAAAIDRWRGEGLYVLFRAGALDRTRVDSLREVLLARRVPFGRTLTVGPTTQSELVERVEQGLKKVVPIARAPGASGSAAAGSAEPAATRPRRQTIPVIPATITRSLPGAATPEPTPPSATPPTAKPAAKPTSGLPRPIAKPTSARPTGPRSMPPSPTTRRIEPATPPTANEDTTAGEHAAGNELTSTSAPPSPDEHTIADEAPAAPPIAVPDDKDANTTVGVIGTADTVAGVGAVDPLEVVEPPRDPEGDDATFTGTHVQVDAAPVAEPTQTKRPDTSVTALEVDADLLDDEDDDVTRMRPKHDDDELPSLDLDGMIAAIGDGPDPAARGNTVIARDDSIAPRGDTVIARVHTLKASAVPFDGYPDDAPEISLSDGEVLVDRTMVTPAQRPPPLPTSLTTTMPTPKTPPPVVEDAPGPSTGKLLVAGVVGALGIGVLIAVLVSRDDGDATASTATKTDVVADASDAKPTDAKTATPGPTPSDPKTEPGTDVKDDGDEAIPEEGKSAEDTEGTAKTEVQEVATPTRPGLASATMKPAAKLPMLARPPAVPPPPKTRVEAALRARELRALDILLVVRKPTKPLSYADAEKHCGAIDVRGIQGWRLPDVGELASLDDAGMLARGFYWSSTSGDTFGDTHMAWNGRTRQAASRMKGSVALCVRGDRGEAQ